MERTEEGPPTQEVEEVQVRTLRLDDEPWVVRIDAQHSGRPRQQFYELKLREAEENTGIRVSLAAEVRGEPAGFLMARLYYGEFGLPEPVAILDALGVAPHFAGQHVATALLEQLSVNLRGLGIERIQTQVEWGEWDLLRFFEHAGFQPAPRLCLELDLAE